MRTQQALVSLLVMSMVGCAAEEDALEDGELDTIAGKADVWGIANNGYLADAIVKYASTASAANLTSIGIANRAVRHVTAAPRPFATLAAVDAVPYTGELFFDKLVSKVQDAGLVGRCGDGIVQALAAEACDGGDCSADCKTTGTLVSIIPTTVPVSGLAYYGGGHLAVHTKSSTNANTMTMAGAMGQTLWTKDIGFTQPRSWRSGSHYAVALGANVVNPATGAVTTAYQLGTSTGVLVYALPDTHVMTDSSNHVVFRDDITHEIVMQTSGRFQGVDGAGAIIVTNASSGKVERWTLDTNDQLIVVPLATYTYQDGPTERTAFVRVMPDGKVVLERFEGEKNRFITYAPGSTTPISDVSFALPRSPAPAFVATNGTYVAVENTNLVVYRSDRTKLGTIRCLNGQGNPHVAEMENSLAIASSNGCGFDKGYFKTPK